MANEQTSVPLYAASEVLTAANMNISAGTGVPVFATTVTRDAAFGGANEKTLAEGQLCYLSASNIVQYYDGAAWATVGPSTAGTKIGQVINGTTTTGVNNSTTTYADTTLTATITPTLATSKVLVLVSQNGVHKTTGNAGNGVHLQLLRTATTISTFANNLGFTNTLLFQILSASVCFLDSPSTTSATTYKTQFKNDVAASQVAVQINSEMSTITLLEVIV